MKKAQGLSLNVIIIAALALIVLIVLIVMFSGKIGLFGKGTSETADLYSGSKCEIPGTGRECTGTDECDDQNGVNMGTFDDCVNGICCAT